MESCFIHRPLDSNVPGDFAKFALAVKCANYWSGSHPLCAIYRSLEIHLTQLSYVSLTGASSHPLELHLTNLSNISPIWATSHPLDPHLTNLSMSTFRLLGASYYSLVLNLTYSELHLTYSQQHIPHLSYISPNWAPYQPHWATYQPLELHYTQFRCISTTLSDR